MTEFEGMAQVVQRGIDEILSLRAINKELLEALKNANSVLERIVDSFPDNESPHPSIQECMDAFVATSEAIRKAEEQS